MHTHISCVSKVTNYAWKDENVGNGEPCRSGRPAKVLVSVDIELLNSIELVVTLLQISFSVGLLHRELGAS